MWRQAVVGLGLCGGCTGEPSGDEAPQPAVSAWGSEPVFTEIASSADALSTPRDLEFHPDHEDQLFVVNQATDSVTVIFDPGAAEQRALEYADAFGNHFMEEVSALLGRGPEYHA
jgi:hypothetical protein